MKNIISLFWAACIALPLIAQEKGKIVIPDLKGYVTLKCDFHIHTMFSDGSVWPTVRIDEAYGEGLDAIAITEHVVGWNELLLKDNLKDPSHNLSYDIAQTYAKTRNMDIILIKGGEMTFSMPPGHFNAIFLSDVDELLITDRHNRYMDAFRAAKAQNAFIWWNHPGWPVQQPDTTLWWDEHTQLLEQGMIHGVDVASWTRYYPEAHRWCLEKKLTMMGSSDMHNSMLTEFNVTGLKHRTMTLVFAKERTAESIHEALKERRTAAYYKDYLIGEEKYLKELFENAVEIKVTKTDNTANITFINKSDLTFHLKKTAHDARLTYFREDIIDPYTIKPHGVLTTTVRLNDGIKGGDVNFSVENFLVEPNKGLRYTVKI